MADKADQALKLAQKLEKEMTNLHDEQSKRMNEMDKRYTDAHNQQAKELEKIMAWAKATFATK